MLINKILRWTALAGIFMLPFIPIIVAPHMFFPFITGKNFAFRILVEIIGVAWLILALRNKEYRPGKSAVFTAVSIFVAIVALADVLGVSVRTSIWSNFERMEGLVTIAHLFVYMIVTSAMLNSMKLWDRFFYTSIGVSLFLSMYGYLQVSGDLQINQGGVRLDATLGNATYMAIYMLFNVYLLLILFFRRTKHFSREILLSYFIASGWFLLFLIHVGSFNQNLIVSKKMTILGVLSAIVLIGAWYLWMHRKVMEKQWVQYVVTGVVLFIQVATLYYTATRGAILGLVGGLLLTSLLVALFEKHRKRLRKVAATSIVVLLLGAVSFIVVRDSAFVKNSPVLSRFSNLSFQEVGSRPLVWNMAIQGIKERPILGWGQNNFDVVFNKYYDPRMYSQEPWFDRAHDVVFDWLINAGIVGLLSYLSLFGVTVYVLWRDNQGKFTLVDKSLITGMLVGYFFHNLLVFDNITSYLMFFAVISYVHTMESIPRKNGTWKLISESKSFVDWIAVPTLSILMVVMIYLVNVKPILASYELIEAIIPHEEGIGKNLEKFNMIFGHDTIGATEAREQLLQLTLEVIASKEAPQEIKEKFFTLTIEQFDRQFKETPLAARHYYFIGAFLRAINRPKDAVVFLERGHELSPKKQIITMELAATYSAVGEKEKALQLFKDTFELERKNDQARLAYAASAQMQGREDIVKEILEERFGTILVAETQIMNAYLATGRTDIIVKIWERLVTLNMKKEGSEGKVRLSLASAYFINHEVEKAVQEIEKVIKIQPDFKEKGEALIRDIRSGKTIGDETLFSVGGLNRGLQRK